LIVDWIGLKQITKRIPVRFR